MSDGKSYNRNPLRSTMIAASLGSKHLLLCALLVFFIFPRTSHEFFQFSDAAGSVIVGHAADAIKSTARHPIERKFKFHKIERVYADEGADDDDDGDASDGDGDDGSESVDITKRHADDSEQDAESVEIPFERARPAHKDRRAVPITGQKRATGKKHKSTVADDENESGESKSLFGGLFSGVGKWGSETKQTIQKQRKQTITSDEEKLDKNKDPSNGIIDWLKWLSERTEESPQSEEIAAADDSESWLTYLNRWPFNSFFPIGKPAKPIRIPRTSRTLKPVVSAEDENSAETATTMSQQIFETVLHSLPSFVVNPSQVTNTECRQQMQIFHRQLRGNKLWTLQMLDATGKITSSILRGNINQFGDFDQCMQVRTVVKVTPEIPLRIRGKYCLAHIEMQTSTKELKVPLHYAQGRGLWNGHLGNPSHFVPRYGVANWGVCVPHLCSGAVVRQMIEANLRPYNTTGIEFHVEVDDDDCYIQPNLKLARLIKKDRKFAMTLFGISTLVALCVGSLLNQSDSNIKTMLIGMWQMIKTKQSSASGGNEDTIEQAAESTEPEDIQQIQEDTEVSADQCVEQEQTSKPENLYHCLATMLQEIMSTFSPQRTLATLLATDRFSMQFPIINLLKLGVTFALYVSLKYLMIGHLPISNRDKLVRAIDQPQSILFRMPMLYMDILLMISGFIAAYQLSVEMEQKSYIQLLKRMALKISRYLPTLYVVLFFQTVVLPLLGAGPLWTNLIGQNTRLCEQQMWRNLFSVQNAIDFEETCSPMTIQLAVEVQLYILGPLIVWLFYTDAEAAFYIYGALHVMSVAARYSLTQREYLSMTLFHGMNVSKFYRTANFLFSSPVCRATPYLLGIGAGVLHRSQADTLGIAAELIPVGWLCAILSIFWCFWSPSMGMRTDFVYTASEAASYAAWCPLILCLALAWCIFMVPTGESSILRFLTTTRPVLFLSRITFPIQLMTYVVVLYNTASEREPRKYHMNDLVNFNEIGVILVCGIVLAFLIDVPAQHIRKIIINRLFMERGPREYDQEFEPSSGAEASEGELEAEVEIEVDSELPAEAMGGIWDTEENAEGVESNQKEAVTEEEDDKCTTMVDALDEEEISENEIVEDDIKVQAQKDDSEEEGKIIHTRRRRRISDD